MMNDLISDLIARIRNAQQRKKDSLSVLSSRVIKSILETLVLEGFIESWTEEKKTDYNSELIVKLKYHQGKPVIKEMNRISKPGCRKYTSCKDLKPFFNGLGVIILSTPKGILSDVQAREKNVGGELLFSIV